MSQLLCKLLSVGPLTLVATDSASHKLVTGYTLFRVSYTLIIVTASGQIYCLIIIKAYFQILPCTQLQMCVFRLTSCQQSRRVFL